MKHKIGLVLLVCLIATCSISACGKSTESEESVKESAETDVDSGGGEKLFKIGDAASNNEFSVLLKNAVFTEAIKYPLNNPELAEDEFFVPSTRDELVDGVDNAILTKADEDNLWLYYSVEVEYIGKEAYSNTDLAFQPVVNYQDYDINTAYLSFIKINDDSWSNLNTDLSQSEISAIGLSFGYNTTLKLEPLSNDKYLIRGAIKVPQKAINDTESEISLKLAGIKFSVR